MDEHKWSSALPASIIMWCLLLLNITLFLRVLNYSWVTDDAMISFRTVLNFVNGYGMCFNVGERVQSFTHPLWFFLLSAGGLLGVNLYFFAIFLGLTLTVLLQYVLFCFYRNTGEFTGYACALVLLIFSETFLQFQTSGLENSLTNTLLISFVYFMAFYPPNRERLIILFLLAAAMVLNRMDHLFLVAVPLLVILKDTEGPRIRSVVSAFLAFSPVMMWSIFSIVYFGALFPNTKYAKVHTGPFTDSLIHGYKYFLEFLQIEFWILIPILALFVTIFLERSNCNTYRRTLITLTVAASTFLTYIICVGGDFMRGRFFDPVVILAVTSITFTFVAISKKWVKLFVVVVTIPVAAYANAIAVNEALWKTFSGIESERNFYRAFLALNLDPNMNYTQHPWALAAQEINAKYRNQTITVLGVNGMMAYFCDRNITLIDPIGLTDAFIARTPVIDSTRTGHFQRKIPQEYLNERINGVISENWESQELHELWRHLKNVTQNPDLFSIQRLRSIWYIWRHYGF